MGYKKKFEFRNRFRRRFRDRFLQTTSPMPPARRAFLPICKVYFMYPSSKKVLKRYRHRRWGEMGHVCLDYTIDLYPDTFMLVWRGWRTWPTAPPSRIWVLFSRKEKNRKTFCEIDKVKFEIIVQLCGVARSFSWSHHLWREVECKRSRRATTESNTMNDTTPTMNLSGNMYPRLLLTIICHNNTEQ